MILHHKHHQNQSFNFQLSSNSTFCCCSPLSSSSFKKLSTMFIRNLHYIINNVTFSAFFFYYYISQTVLYVSEQSDDLLDGFSRIVFQLPLWTYFTEQYFNYRFRRRKFKEDEAAAKRIEEEHVFAVVTDNESHSRIEQDQNKTQLTTRSTAMQQQQQQLTSPTPLVFFRQRQLSCFNVSFVALVVYFYWLLRRPAKTIRERHFCLYFFLSFGNLLFFAFLVYLFILLILYRNSETTCHTASRIEKWLTLLLIVPNMTV